MFTKISQTSFRASNYHGLDIIEELFDGMVSWDSFSNSWELLFGSRWNIFFIISFFLLAFFVVDIVVLLSRWRRRLMRFILVYFLVFFILTCPTCGCVTPKNFIWLFQTFIWFEGGYLKFSSKELTLSKIFLYWQVFCLDSPKTWFWSWRFFLLMWTQNQMLFTWEISFEKSFKIALWLLEWSSPPFQNLFLPWPKWKSPP